MNRTAEQCTPSAACTTCSALVFVVHMERHKDWHRVTHTSVPLVYDEHGELEPLATYTK